MRRLAAALSDSGLPRPNWPEISFGAAALIEAATAPAVDMVISAIVGVAGLEATYEAVRLGKRVGLANKEVLVSGGRLVMDAVKESGAELAAHRQRA
jgi:1-deoxy-D-xylulose-5-phosphate reductoisomerase